MYDGEVNIAQEYKNPQKRCFIVIKLQESNSVELDQFRRIYELRLILMKIVNSKFGYTFNTQNKKIHHIYHFNVFRTSVVSKIDYAFLQPI